MLCFSRKREQRTKLIVPPSDKPTVIDLTICRITDSQVQLGWEAPRVVQIVRGELEAKGEAA